MLSALLLENWKGFKGRHVLPLKDITLLYGPNSGGKSSILQALLSTNIADGTRPLFPAYLDFRQGWRNFGSFKENVHGQKIGETIRIGFEFDSCQSFLMSDFKPVIGSKDRIILSYQATDSLSGWSIRPAFSYPDNLLTQIRLETDMLERADFDVKLGPWCNPFRLNAGNDPEFSDVWNKLSAKLDPSAWINYLDSRLAGWDPQEATRGIYRRLFTAQGEQDLLPALSDHTSNFEQTVDSVRNTLSRELYSFDPDARLGDPSILCNDVQELSARTALLLNHLLHPLSFLETIQYIGPIREAPDKYRSLSNRHGANYYESRNLNTSSLTGSWKDDLHQINAWLVRLKLPYKVVMSSVKNDFSHQIETLLLEDLRTGTTHNIDDVGYGLSQLLPILKQPIDNGKARFILAEQPELHLHPRLQADLADYFIESACNQNETGKHPLFSGATRWLIETHSEALLLRIQRRIREGTLDPNRVAVIHVGRIDELGSFIKQIRLSESGEFLDEWPGGFFEEDFDEIFGDETE